MEDSKKIKAVAFIRVSTSRQDLYEQKTEVLNVIKEDGYSEKDTIVIEVKASTIKLDQSYMDAIDELEEVIKSGEVACVYIWALNRLTRKTFIATRFAEILEKNKVRLKLLNPKMELFSGEFGMQQKMLITNMATVAEMEMELKQKDFKRTKDAYKKEGKFCGGIVKFGYTLNDSNHFVKDNKSAEVIRKIYEMYSKQKYTIAQIYTHIYDMGWNEVFENRENPKQITYNVIGDILSDESYVGRTSKKSQDKYPAIITNDLFDKVQKIRAGKNKNVSRQKHYLFGSKLIKCTDCGGNFTQNNSLYHCWKHSNQQKKQGLQYCDNATSISISVMDSILWEEAKLIEYGRLNLNNDVLLKNLNDAMDEIIKKIEVCSNETTKLNDKEDKIEDIYLANGNKDKYMKRMEDLKVERTMNIKKMEQLTIEKSDIQNKINSMVGNKKHKDIYKRMMELETTTDAEVMNDLIHQLIHKVTITEEDEYKIIKIYPKPLYGNVYFKKLDADGNMIYYDEYDNVISPDNAIGGMMMVGGNGIYKVRNRRADDIQFYSMLNNQWYNIDIAPLIHNDKEKIAEVLYKTSLEERMKKYKSSDATVDDLIITDKVMSKLSQIKKEKGDITSDDVKDALSEVIKK